MKEMYKVRIASNTLIYSIPEIEILHCEMVGDEEVLVAHGGGRQYIETGGSTIFSTHKKALKAIKRNLEATLRKRKSQVTKIEQSLKKVQEMITLPPGGDDE